MNSSLLLFSLGPVQEFIEAARTPRDLWTGSYLLSWLTAHAIHKVLDDDGDILSPTVAGNPLYQAISATTHNRDDNALLPCLPNTFWAKVSGENAETIAKTCEKAVREEWAQISKAVHNKLNEKWGTDYPNWDFRWHEQAENFWDIRVTTLKESDVPSLINLLPPKKETAFQNHRELLARLAAAAKQIRHYPPHECANGQIDTRPKCSLLGSYAQMGSPGTGDFWRQLADSSEKTTLSGVRLRSKDRLCAVSLIKRFAWPAYLAGRLKLSPSALRYPDLHTVCASSWLKKANTHGIDPLNSNDESGNKLWSGHWLGWRTRKDGKSTEADARDQEPCPDKATWESIQSAKKTLGSPPVYYAVLMLDVDKMGDRAKAAKNEEELQELSEVLVRFATSKVKQIVEKHWGTLIYAGGDDVFALLPVATAVECAKELNDELNQLKIRNEAVKCSAGIAVAHLMTNLKEVLAECRKAEKEAKNQGRDSLAVRIMKRSGEHSTVVMKWDQVTTLTALVAGFGGENGPSDRWAYKFRQELESLPDDIEGLLEKEMKRLLNRTENIGNNSQDSFQSQVNALWNGVVKTPQPDHHIESSPRKKAEQFVMAVQTAAFLARGGGEKESK